MHECVSCGDYCWCDVDDLLLPAPHDCTHDCDPDDDWDDDWDMDDDEREAIQALDGGPNR